MKKYKTVIFDLFDTLIDFNRSRLPELTIDGQNIRSTFLPVYKVFKEHYKPYPIGKFHDSFVESFNEFQELKQKDNKEYHNRERFKLLLNKLNIEVNSNHTKLVDAMVLAHMNSLASTMEFPEENRRVLNMIKEKNYKMAIVSNFDHSPTAYTLLSKFNIKHFFSEIVISVEVGWRKPDPKIFNEVLSLIDITPAEAIYIGDNFFADVIGSKSIGMDVIWINRHEETIQIENYIPDYEVSKLSDVFELF